MFPGHIRSYLNRLTRWIFIILIAPFIDREGRIIVFIHKFLAVTDFSERVEPGAPQSSQTIDIMNGIPVHRDLLDGNGHIPQGLDRSGLRVRGAAPVHGGSPAPYIG